MLKPGTILDNKYVIEAVIGRGGFGHVYRARERLTGESVAVKELVSNLLHDEQMVQRFIQEARATLRLTHPNIARTHGLFADRGTYYLAMEYLPGGSLADRMKTGPLPMAEAVRIARELCDALGHAHREGVVHCDIKPANVLFDARGRVRLADFGIAYVSSQMMTRQFHTSAGTAMGTVRYMAPEQLEGVRDDPRVDVYAMGAMLYEMLAGKPYLDFESESSLGTQMRNMQRIQTESPTPLRQINPQVPDRLASAVEQALHKQPGSRPQTVAALKQLLTPRRESPSPVDQRGRQRPAVQRDRPAAQGSREGPAPTQKKRKSVSRWIVMGFAAFAGIAALTAITLLALQAARGSGAASGGSTPLSTVALQRSPIPSSPAPTAPPTEVVTEQSEQPPTDQPSEGLGTEDNPITWSFVPSGDTDRVTAGARRVADLLHDETGLYFDTNTAGEYAGVIEGMCSDPPEAHMGSLPTFSYVLANERCGVEAELVAVRFGGSSYNGQLMTRADSGIDTIADLEGKTFCRPDPLSTSGWVIPSLSMRAEGINPEEDLAEIVDAGSHDAVVAAVYDGECDAGSSYVDARTILQDRYEDVLERVIVFHRTVDIPNDGIQFVASMDDETKGRIVHGLLTIAETEEGQEALSAAYNWSGLERQGDEFYAPFKQVLQASGVSIEDLVSE